MNKFKSFKEFTAVFSNQEKCLEYLCQVKWENGFQCRRCGHERCIKGRTWYYRRCQKCRYDESCTSNTLFHKLKFSIVSAFWICYQLSNHKKGISTMEIARQYGIHQETAWFYKRKVQEAMSSSLEGDHPIEVRMFIIDKMVEKKDPKFLDQSERKQRRNCKNSSRAMANNRVELGDKGFEYSSRGLQFLKRRVGQGMKLEFCNQIDKIDNELYWYLHNMKNWIVGIHHQVSIFHSKRYLDEFCYRFVHRHHLEKQHLLLIESMVHHRAQSYNTVKAK